MEIQDITGRYLDYQSQNVERRKLRGTIKKIWKGGNRNMGQKTWAFWWYSGKAFFINVYD